MNRMDELVSELRQISRNPKAELDKVISQGKKAVGCMTYFCPEELVYAGGMVPFGLWGAELQVSEAKRYLPSFICSILQTTLELGIRGEYDRLSAVMIPILCDSLKGMDGNWRYAVKTVPVIPIAHAQNRKTPAGVEFTASQYRKARRFLEELSEKIITDEAVSDAVRVYNERRAVMRRFIKVCRKQPGMLSPSDRNAVFKSSYFMDVREHMAKVLELTELMERMPVKPFTGAKIVTSGIIADNTALLKILDDCGIAIVDDEVTHESLRFRTDVPVTDDPIIGMARQIGEIEGCSVLYDPGKTRGKLLIELARKSNADGILLVQTKFCDPEEYDFVPIKCMLDNAGMRSLQVEIDQQASNTGQARTAVETFCEIIRN
jgi:benzoyl-CoA reductase/2-hydroxyglutaryl-CoA dehydratase subunit BcrC/BadD/HgdB